ncbi:MAG: LacI family DNA-binding transcriptional regulator [Candidatus Caldatribacterium sp.]|nr:LacI family DNA-binding transcriptional regulator [Candidatus Caldatribacterium sp.]
MVTIAEIARLAGVSKATVSNVLNGRTDQVSPETRARIERIMKECGYVPKRAARSLKSNRTRTIALLFPHLPASLVANTFFFPGFLSGVARACEESSYQLLITTSAKSCDTEFHYEALVQSRSVDGFIVSEIFVDDPRFSVLRKFNVPFVSIGKPEGEDVSWISWVDHNQEELAYQATRKLVELGHRDILFVGLSRSRVYTMQRLSGYRRALEEAKISIQEQLILTEEMKKEELPARLQKLLQKGIGFSALFVTDGPLTLSALRALQDLGLRIPQDVSLLGNIEGDNDRFYFPRLSGIRVKAEELGYETVKLLVQHIEGKMQVPVGKYIEADFVEGYSVGPYIGRR